MGGFSLGNVEQLINDLTSIGEGVTKAQGKEALRQAAVPVRERLMTLAPERTGKLKQAIKASRINQWRGKMSVSIGVYSGEEAAKYAHLVEFGHGGPHPAPAHPFMQPAYDETEDEAYQILKSALKQAMTN